MSSGMVFMFGLPVVTILGFICYFVWLDIKTRRGILPTTTTSTTTTGTDLPRVHLTSTPSQPTKPASETKESRTERIRNQLSWTTLIETEVDEEQGGDTVRSIPFILPVASNNSPVLSPVPMVIKNQRQDSSKKAECSICLDNYKAGETIGWAKTDQCKHIFHQDCIIEWLQKHDACPLCRKDLMKETCNYDVDAGNDGNNNNV